MWLHYILILFSLCRLLSKEDLSSCLNECVKVLSARQPTVKLIEHRDKFTSLLTQLTATQESEVKESEVQQGTIMPTETTGERKLRLQEVRIAYLLYI